MAIRHVNPYGKVEYLDRPLSDCSCNGCEGARRRERRSEVRRSQRRSSGWQTGGSVSGEPAKTKQSGERIEALWGGSEPEGDGDDHGHIASNDGLNADYVRYPGEEPIVNRKRRRGQR